MELSKVPNLQLSVKRTNTCEKDINALKKKHINKLKSSEDTKWSESGVCVYVCAEGGERVISYEWPEVNFDLGLKKKKIVG